MASGYSAYYPPKSLHSTYRSGSYLGGQVPRKIQGVQTFLSFLPFICEILGSFYLLEYLKMLETVQEAKVTLSYPHQGHNL